MELLPAELIRKKRFGSEHALEEIRFLIQGYAQDRIPDYQIAAWLMAICLKGMTGQETAWLTHEMRDSGCVLDFSSHSKTVDKHSTGGVGDKVSLILAPLVAAAGVSVPMMAGRGLGHTGGTLDKLESISGFSTELTLAQFESQVRELGVAIMGQTVEICPADRKLYALRDVTGTIDSLPLICGSIMSKKLAEGIHGLVLDVKYGSGAFMKSVAEAEELARALMEIGRHSGRHVHALLTQMDEPLGRFVGNALEVKECLEILTNQVPAYEGKKPDDTRELTLELAGHMIFLGGKALSVEAGRKHAAELLANGAAYEKFQEMCREQGGDLKKPLPQTANTQIIAADRDGFLHYSNCEKIGLAGIVLGAGRREQTDTLDLSAGIEVFRAHGDAVKKGDTIFKLYAEDKTRFSAAVEFLNQSFVLQSKAAPRSPLIAKVLT